MTGDSHYLKFGGDVEPESSLSSDSVSAVVVPDAIALSHVACTDLE